MTKPKKSQWLVTDNFEVKELPADKVFPSKIDALVHASILAFNAKEQAVSDYNMARDRIQKLKCVVEILDKQIEECGHDSRSVSE